MKVIMTAIYDDPESTPSRLSMEAISTDVQNLIKGRLGEN
jgi:hypothetical protein